MYYGIGLRPVWTAHSAMQLGRLRSSNSSALSAHCPSPQAVRPKAWCQEFWSLAAVPSAPAAVLLFSLCKPVSSTLVLHLGLEALLVTSSTAAAACN